MHALLEPLISTATDVLNNCADANLKLVTRALLVALPEESLLVCCEGLVGIRDRHVLESTSGLVARVWETEVTVNDLLATVGAFEGGPNPRGVSESEIITVKAHYSRSMYQMLREATMHHLKAV